MKSFKEIPSKGVVRVQGCDFEKGWIELVINEGGHAMGRDRKEKFRIPKWFARFCQNLVRSCDVKRILNY